MEAEMETPVDPGVEQAEEEPPAPEEPVVDDDPDQDEGVDDAEPAAAEPPPAQGLSIEELEKVRGQLDRSATTWRNRVSQLLGEEALMLVPCELCDPLLPGFHFPAEVESPRDDLHARLLDVLRAPAAPEYQPDPFTLECTTCRGLGKTLTKSHVPGKGERVCPTCGGDGFKIQGGGPAAQSPNGNAEEVQYNLPSEEPLVADGADVWGSPKLLPDGMENPNYGKMPQYKNPTLP